MTNNISVVFETDYQNSCSNCSNLTQFCEEWPQATKPAFQVGNGLHLLAFLIPHTFTGSVLASRSVLCLGQLTFMLWASISTCALDIILWNMVLLLVNLTASSYLFFKLCPPFIPKHLVELYEKLFKPLEVSKRQFKQLINESDEVRWLDKGEYYAVEEVSTSGKKLSLMLSGKVRVSCDSAHLHFIFPNQFVDSVEWEAQEFITAEHSTFQVTIQAEERSQIVTWTRDKIVLMKETNAFLASIIHCLIGKDITYKLYSLSDHQKKSSLSIINPATFGKIA